MQRILLLFDNQCLGQYFGSAGQDKFTYTNVWLVIVFRKNRKSGQVRIVWNNFDRLFLLFTLSLDPLDPLIKTEKIANGPLGASNAKKLMSCLSWTRGMFTV